MFLICTTKSAAACVTAFTPLAHPGADRDGTVLDAPPLAHEIAADPLLADRQILAAPGDAGLLARGGTRGFPHWAAWSERPAGFAADIVRFLAEGGRRCMCSCWVSDRSLFCSHAFRGGAEKTPSVKFDCGARTAALAALEGGSVEER